MIGLYFHIPFCIGKCKYCNFDSLPASDYTDSFVRRYIYAVCREMAVASVNEDGKVPVDTVFFGGGTPSLMDPAAIEFILREAGAFFEISPGAEISMEVNPGTVELEKMLAYRNVSVNRISIGGQSFDDSHLSFLGRIHKSSELKNAVLAAKEAGFKNINIDLIFGFPGQTPDSFTSDLEKAVSLDVEHLSVYMFTPEEGTLIGDDVLNGRQEQPEDECLAEMMHLAHQKLTDCGYNHYELSNYAKPGYECGHNLKYWNYSGYRGFGSSACTFRRGFRYKNIADPYEYVFRTEHNFLPIESGEKLSLERRMGEYVMLALRTSLGVDEELFSRLFACSFSGHYKDVIAYLSEKSLLVNKNKHWYIPVQYFPLQSEISSEFIL